MASEKAFCGGSVVVLSNSPSVPGEYRSKDALENVLQLGEYIPYRVSVRDDDFMFRLAVQKRIFGRPAEARVMVQEASGYLDSWRLCVGSHERKPATFCYSSDFRALLRSNFESMERALAALGSYEDVDFQDFGRVIEFSRKWNALQRSMRDTFFAHLAYYPAWLDEGEGPRGKRESCADCHQFDSVPPPVPTFVMLGAFFLPRDARMPDGTRIPEGIILHEKAGEYQEAHEHAHAYVHERKSLGPRPHCEWIEEGIADWAAMAMTHQEDIEGRYYREMYDSWRAFAAMPEEDRRELVRAWCHEPEKYDWGKLREDAVELIREASRKKGASMLQETVKLRLTRYKREPKR
jgi:hypothetical protein